mmetsp:Transcript_28326/g.82066  ORF Transcript_28326/g.82066 Transcript_28326/m.82066 type:complete len:240 (-) Transcript_28326:897-1616(-)
MHPGCAHRARPPVVVAGRGILGASTDIAAVTAAAATSAPVAAAAVAAAAATAVAAANAYAAAATAPAAAVPTPAVPAAAAAVAAVPTAEPAAPFPDPAAGPAAAAAAPGRRRHGDARLADVAVARGCAGAGWGHLRWLLRHGRALSWRLSRRQCCWWHGRELRPVSGAASRSWWTWPRAGPGPGHGGHDAAAGLPGDGRTGDGHRYGDASPRLAAVAAATAPTAHRGLRHDGRRRCRHD